MAGAFVARGLSLVARRVRAESLPSGGQLVRSLASVQALMENRCPNVQSPAAAPMDGGPFTILVEGNIGSGKTTFLKQFEHLRNATILPEPVSRWTAVGGQHNLLQLMYEQPTKYALALQTYVQLTMLQNHRQAVNTEFKLMERSLYSARYCFVENLFRSGLLSEVETLILDEWFQHLVKSEASACRADVIVYLRSDPEVALKRVQLRAREGEKTVGLDYLRALHDLHEQWFYKKSKFPLPCERVVCIDANQDPETICEEFHERMRLFDLDSSIATLSSRN